MSEMIAPQWAAKNALPGRVAEWVEQYAEMDGQSEPAAGWQGGWMDGYERGLAAGRAEGFRDGWNAVSVEHVNGQDINPVDGSPLALGDKL